MEPCDHQGVKRHARLRHASISRPFWVDDPDDWAAVRWQPRPPLTCPEPGCEVELISYENLHNRYNPRIFKFKAAGLSCDHWTPLGVGGGPEGAEHRWFKLWLSRTATDLGYRATPEHPPTRSDVYVHEACYCFEVQLRSTQFRKRTAAREGKGAKVCWFIREGLDTDAARKALFRLPAVRFRVVDGNEPALLSAPWEDPNNRRHAHGVRVQVFGTVASLDRTAGRQSSLCFRTRTLDGSKFLEEVLCGHRRWYRPNMLGRKSGLWALRSDVSLYYAQRRGRSQKRE